MRRQSGKGVDEEDGEFDDFETVAEKPKKVTRIKTIEPPQGNIFDRNALKAPEGEKSESAALSQRAVKSEAEEVAKEPE